MHRACHDIAQLTLPSSHCTSNLWPLSSSTIQPLTKAACGSLSQTYRLPEKSFSPSMPLTASWSMCDSSVLMNEGAKVFELEEGVPALCAGVKTPDRGRALLPLPLPEPLGPLGPGEALREKGLLRTDIASQLRDHSGSTKMMVENGGLENSKLGKGRQALNVCYGCHVGESKQRPACTDPQNDIKLEPNRPGGPLSRARPTTNGAGRH